MCLRVFVATVRPLASTGPGPNEGGPYCDLYLHPVDEALAGVRALLGDGAMEAGAYEYCSCGFNAYAASWTSGASHREALVGLEDALTDHERREYDGSLRSCTALSVALAPHLTDGPVRVLVSYWGEESEAPEEAPAKRLADLTRELEPFPKGVLFELVA